MSDLTDYLIDRELAWEVDSDYWEEAETYTYWTMKNGQNIALTEMTIMHITNTINMLERGSWPYREAWISAFEDELRRRIDDV